MSDSDHAVQIVVFRLVPDADREAFLRVTEQLVDWLREQPGFVGYQLYEGQQDWADRLEWDTSAHAEQARRNFTATEVYADLITYLADDYRSMIGHLRHPGPGH